MHNSLINSLQKFLGIGNIVPIGRGSLGIYAALRVWRNTGIVAVPSAVCQDVIAAILMAGWQPFFCDVDPDTGLTKESEWLRARQSGAIAAIVVHLYGNVANTSYAKDVFINGLVIDDAAQALGARLSLTTPLAGTGGDIGLISFGKSKQIEVGGAILVSHDSNFAKACVAVLASVVSSTNQECLAANLLFQNGRQVARQKLLKKSDISGFAGLLNEYAPALRLSWKPEWSDSIEKALALYPNQLAIRHEKANIWRKVIANTKLIPIGMGLNSAPWRFACRLPGCDWQKQNKLGNALRFTGLEVSHWYMPGHWLIDPCAQSLPGAEQLAQETFQFWLDASVDAELIQQSEKILHEIFNCRKVA